jgi:hypothetical protein
MVLELVVGIAIPRFNLGKRQVKKKGNYSLWNRQGISQIIIFKTS